MITLIKLRRKLNFTIEDMARCLGVRHSQVLRAEKVDADLPAGAYLRILKLYEFLEISGVVADEEARGDERTLMMERYKEDKFICDHKIKKLQEQLDNLKEVYRSNQVTFKVLNMVEAGGDVVFPSWLAVAKCNSRSKISKSSIARQHEIGRKIVSLQAESAFLGQKISELMQRVDRAELNVTEESVIEMASAGPQDYQQLRVIKPARSIAPSFETQLCFSTPLLEGGVDANGGRGGPLLRSFAPPKDAINCVSTPLLKGGVDANGGRGGPLLRSSAPPKTQVCVSTPP